MAKGSRDVPTTRTSQRTIAPWVSSAGQKAFEDYRTKAADVSQPFTTAQHSLGQPFAAAFAPEHETYFTETANRAFGADPYLSAAGGTAMTPDMGRDIRVSTGEQRYTDPETGRTTVGFEAFTPENLSRFANPYQQMVTDVGMDELRRQGEMDLLGAQDAAAQAGAFGGARHGVLEAETKRNLADKRNQFLAPVLQQGYREAVGAREGERNALMQGLQLEEGLRTGDISRLLGVGQATQGLGLQGAEAMRGVGDVKRGREQQIIDAAFGEYRRPLTELAMQGQMLSGLPYDVSTSGRIVEQEARPDRLGQVLGAGASLGSAYMMSDKRTKTDRKPVAVRDFALKRFRELPIETYRYKPGAQKAFDLPGNDRVGPMAQDWQKAFDDGDGTLIDIPNAIGMTMLAVKELDAKLERAF